MRKRLLSLILGAAMVMTMLAGCGSSSSGSATAPTETTESSDTTEAADTSDADAADETTASSASLAEQAIADRKAEAEKTGVYPKVVFAFYTWTGEPAGTKRVQEKICEYTRETLGLDVELLVQDSASYAQNVRGNRLISSTPVLLALRLQ